MVMVQAMTMRETGQRLRISGAAVEQIRDRAVANMAKVMAGEPVGKEELVESEEP